MSITEVADQAEASEGSIVGLCRRLGTSGFQELKILLSRDLVEPVQFIQEDLHEGDSIEQVSDRIFAAHTNSLADTRKLLSAPALSKGGSDRARCGTHRGLRHRKLGADRGGLGLSFPAARASGRGAHRLPYPGGECGDDRTTGCGDHHLPFRQHRSKRCSPRALRRRPAPQTIGITRFGKSPLQRYCDVVLHTVANETRYRPEAMSSRVAQLAIVDTLVSCCALADPEKSVANLQRSAQVIAEKRY